MFGPTRESFTHLETSPLPVKGYKFGPMAIKQNCDTGKPFIMLLQGLVTLRPVAERLAVELSLPVLLGMSQMEIEPRSPACEASALPLRHRGG